MAGHIRRQRSVGRARRGDIAITQSGFRLRDMEDHQRVAVAPATTAATPQQQQGQQLEEMQEMQHQEQQQEAHQEQGQGRERQQAEQGSGASQLDAMVDAWADHMAQHYTTAERRSCSGRLELGDLASFLASVTHSCGLCGGELPLQSR